MDNPLRLIVLRAADPERTVQFYQALGLELTREQHGSGPVHYACDRGALVFEIYPAQPGQAGHEPSASTVMLGFEVESLVSVLRALALLGIAVPAAPTGPRVRIEDPDGRAVDIRRRA